MGIRSWRRRDRRSTPTPDAPATPSAAATSTATLVSVDDLLAEADAIEAADGPFAAIEHLQQATAGDRDPIVDARILRLRHLGYESLTPGEPPAEWPPAAEDRFAGVDGCPEVHVRELTADLLASAIRHHGCLLVRELVDPERSAELVETIDRSFAACDEKVAGDPRTWPTSWYSPFRPSAGYPGPKEGHRGWVRAAGGVLAADSPPAFETMIRSFEAVGLREVIGGYMGERPVLSVDKCTLRRVPLDLDKAEWHQDGSFLGDGIRALNVWLALSPCGGDETTAGLDLVPRRFDAIVPTGTPGAWFDWSVSPTVVEEVSVDAPVIRPHFDAGDALLFDDLFLHRTALPETVTTERYAIESWFFAGSKYPGDSVPIVF